MKQEIWSWGAGTEGQLCTGKVEDEHKPQLLHSLASFSPISFLSCGGAHVIALTTGGKVLTWGRGNCGQLGHGEFVNSLQPKLVNSFTSFVITQVSAGWNHSGFVSEKGCLFTCGDDSFGQLGHGNYTKQCSPVKVLYFDSKQVVQIACGLRHSLALLKGHEVYGFGSGKRGQLGLSNDKVRSISLPQRSLGLEDVKVIRVSANGDHSAALSANGCVYTWGRGFGGGLDVHTPECIMTSSLSFTQASLGWNHALVLTSDNEVFMLGGTLSNPHHTTTEDGLERICGLKEIKVVQIATGAEHSAIVTDDGLVMTWGWGEHGQLGLGDIADQSIPQVVCLATHSLDQTKSSMVFCGSGFTFTINNFNTK